MVFLFSSNMNSQLVMGVAVRALRKECEDLSDRLIGLLAINKIATCYDEPGIFSQKRADAELR